MRVIETQRSENKIVLIGAITFEILKERLKFTERREDNWDPYSLNQKINNEESNKLYYQRVKGQQRVQEISNFIESTIEYQIKNQSSIKTIFPSSVIVAFDYFEDLSQKEMEELDMNKIEEKGLIVDGQHRFAAMLALLEKYEGRPGQKFKQLAKRLLQYRFNCTILLNFDLWEQAELFVNVNFHQKKVNKSLYYDIFGSLPPDSTSAKRNPIFLAHDLTKYLNYSEKSPLKGFIKMLGSGSGYFSQAMFVESILAHFNKRGVWSNIEEDYRNDGDIVKSLPRIFVGYFNALKNTFEDQWPSGEVQRYKSILCKTTGIGATVRLLGYLYKLLSDGTYPNKEKFDFQASTLSQVEAIFESIFSQIRDKGEQLFGPESPFAGGGSVGFQSKLYKQLITELGIEKNTK